MSVPHWRDAIKNGPILTNSVSGSMIYQLAPNGDVYGTVLDSKGQEVYGALAIGWLARLDDGRDAVVDWFEDEKPKGITSKAALLYGIGASSYNSWTGKPTKCACYQGLMIIEYCDEHRPK